MVRDVLGGAFCCWEAPCGCGWDWYRPSGGSCGCWRSWRRRWSRWPPPFASGGETLLRLLAAQRQRPLAGPYYGAVLAALEEGISFPAAWRQGFAALSGEGGRILRRLEPEGDEQRILGELTWAAGELTELRRGLEQESRQREKLWFAGLFSGRACC